ncbi:putative gibberellin regulated protein [Lupinus albus]|uniref:Putative gibberellin regulated protein n=1 Tax=Lupinus albus TaxID=3870 RepID=A0A6A4QJ16_LUPAL|nr:putative gibberellin regulated protein [Lupinus albus]
MKLVFVTVLLVCFVLSSSLLEGSLADVCGSKCAFRCSKAKGQEDCLKYCGICCNKCNNCVPSGTFGNKDECPCYRDLKNSKGESKCP